MSKINIFILDILNNEKEEIIIDKPETYQELLKYLINKNKLYEIFIYDNDNNKIIINDEDKYKLIKDIIFIKEIEDLDKSIFSINYDKLSESRQEILEEKYNCKICSIIIKNENPYLCYKCQKIFHEKCLKDWDNKCKLKNKYLECPNCRNKLSIENWNKKLDHDNNRIDNVNLLNKLNEYELNNIMYNNKIILKDKTIKIYEDYINKAIIAFKNISKKINKIYDTMKIKSNNKLNELINNYNLNIGNMNDISNIINDELDNINNIIFKYKSNENQINNIINNKDKINNELNGYKSEINLIYEVKNKSECNIFGNKFVKNNANNIKLKINGKNNKLVDKYELKEGENIITLIIKKELTNLSYMFQKCNNLKDIRELKYLNINKVKDFNFMFYECSSLSDIKPLENWNVSNGKDFSSMFYECSSLSDIKSLQKWNVSNGKDFSNMFHECHSLSDIKSLQNWKDFKNMFDKDKYH